MIQNLSNGVSLQQKKARLKELEEELKEMELLERIANSLKGEGNRPFYEEEMSLDYWRRKKQLRDEIWKLRKELAES